MFGNVSETRNVWKCFTTRDIKLKETTQELDLTKERFQIAEITNYYDRLILQKEHKQQNDCDEL